MLKHARARGRIGRIVGSVNPLMPKPGTAYQWLPMEDTDVIERKMKRLRGLMSDIDNVYFNIKSRAAFLLPGAAVAWRSARRAGHRARRAERRPVARARWPRPASTAISTSTATASNDTVLPWDIIDGGMKASFFRSEFDKSSRAEWTLPPKRSKENARLLPVLT